jgi:adenylate cyclase
MTDERANRKMSVILSADVKGYSRLMSADEEGTVKALNDCREIIARCVDDHRGRIVDSPGDNVLAEFVSTVEAIKCAVKMQEDLKVRNDDLPESERMEFRIGINLGDVIEEGDRIYGDGVNIAARLEGLSEAGGICISGTAFDQVKGKLSLGYQFVGKQTVKNIPDPIRAYKVLMASEDAGKIIGEAKPNKWRWVLAAAAMLAAIIVAFFISNIYFGPPPIESASVEKMAFPLPDKPSIAVLPFTNLSGEKEQEYFCDGLSEGIINGLSKSEHIFVIARNSTFTYKNKPVQVKQVAEEMGVRYVIEGSVQREKSRVRVTAQLIDALTGHHLFSERYDRDLEDILNLQDEITLKVLTAVQVKLIVGEGAHVSEKGTKNLDAYLKVLEARELKAGAMNKERVEKAMKLLEEAIALDPEYAYAYSILSTAYIDLLGLGASVSPREHLMRAIELGEKAVALDKSNSSAHANLAFPYIFLKKFDKAIEEAEKGVSLSPGSAAAYFALGTALFSAGRPQEAIPIFQKCLRLSPVPIHSQALGFLAISYVMIGRYEEGIATYKKVLQIYGPDNLMAHLWMVDAYMLWGREDEARAEAAEVLRIEPKFSVEQFVKNMPISPDRRDRLTRSLLKAGLK